MTATGGAALAVGIWYQTIGGAVSLVAPWVFTNTLTEVEGAVQALGQGDRPREVLNEYFDMDTATFENSAVSLFQFKATSKMNPDPFGPAEIRDIFSNATRCILNHHDYSQDSISAFILASNRQKGLHIEALESAIQRCKHSTSPQEFMAAFETAVAPIELFPSEKAQDDTSSSDTQHGDGLVNKQRTMADLARSITYHLSDTGSKSREERAKACLLALSRFSFAAASPQSLLEALTIWLNSWGILPHEHESYYNHILGTLQYFSEHNRRSSEQDVMAHVLNAPKAQPLSPSTVWSSVVRDLRDFDWGDPPTRRLLNTDSELAWMLDRSDLLRGLPFQFADYGPDEASPDDYYVNYDVPPRVFAFVGPGGTGKTELLSHLLFTIAGSIWDWAEDKITDHGSFIGYPVILEADVNAFEHIEHVVQKWTKRSGAMTDPVNRCGIACGAQANEPVMWIAFDGLDEVLDIHRAQLIRKIANYADTHTSVRILLTSRETQFKNAQNMLAKKGLLRVLNVDDFRPDEATEALLLASEAGVLLGQNASNSLRTGNRIPGLIASPHREQIEFESSIRQPLFIGVLRRLFEQHGASMIQEAYDGDPLALDVVAETYIRFFCERAARRLGIDHVVSKNVFNALRELATIVKEPQHARAEDWSTVCYRYIDGRDKWRLFYDHCAASGLIRTNSDPGAFEWRHPFVGRRLPNMEEPSAWK